MKVPNLNEMKNEIVALEKEKLDEKGQAYLEKLR